MRIARFTILLSLAVCGCTPPTQKLTFPKSPLSRTADAVWYDMNGDGKADFGLLRDASGRFDTLAYDDDEDGKPDRLYRLRDYSNESVPHLIILLDSIPYQAVADRYARGEFAWFDPPQKVIPPFPSLSEQIFSRILGAPPLPGVIDNNYDPEAAQVNSGVWKRVTGYHQPWEFRTNYAAKYWEAGLAYMEPQPWYQIELMRSKDALDKSPDRVTIVYFVSASAMLCRLGEPGLNECLDDIQRLCLELLWERRGALKISMCADHGHNLMRSVNISNALADTLREQGFHPTEHLRHPNDVVINLDGLITYVGLHTIQPAAVTTAALKRPEIELASYLEQDYVIVRDHEGAAKIEYRENSFRYTPIDRDVLGYAPIVESLRQQGKLSTDGYASDADWFAATVDQQFPDAPRRLWDAFHAMAVHPPDVMLTIRDGWCCGTPTLEKFITMASTHGGLNQVNSATFLMTMTGRATKPIRSKDIIPTVEPGYVIPVRPR